MRSDSKTEVKRLVLDKKMSQRKGLSWVFKGDLVITKKMNRKRAFQRVGGTTHAIQIALSGVSGSKETWLKTLAERRKCFQQEPPK